MKVWSAMTWMSMMVLAGGVALLAGEAVQAVPAGEGGAKLDGKEIFLATKCDLCHSVSAAGIQAKAKSEKMQGKDLTDVGTRHEREWIGKFVRGEETLDGAKHKRPFKGSDEELKALLDWLMAQKSK